MTVDASGQISPTLFADPENQRKLADNALTSLGLHPDQLGARSLLDAHFSGPTAHPEVAEVVKPIVGSAPPAAPAAAPATPPLIDTTPAKIEGTSNPEPITSIEPPKETAASTPSNPTAPTAPAAAPTAPSAPAASFSIPSPDSKLDLIHSNTENSTLGAQGELKRLIDTGSGIHQIHNPWLHGLATAGEIAGDFAVPNLMKDIPGTEEHHAQLIRNEEGLVNQGLRQGQEEATTKKTEEAPVPDYTEWKQEHPDGKIEDYWKDKNKIALSTRNPDQQELAFLTAPREEGGLGLTLDQAYEHMLKTKAANKPQTAASLKADFEGLISKMSGGQPLDPALTNDMTKLVSAIGTSKNLNDEEKQKAFSYLVANSTPASSAYAPQERLKGLGSMRLNASIDTQTGGFAWVTPEMNAQAPGRYIPATQGAQAMSKESVFRDMHFNIDQVRETIQNLKTNFDAVTRAQLAYVLRNPNPGNALSSFLQSGAAKTLTDDQIDYVTALASLMENANALRSVAGMGQGSDELRAAIMRAIPGPNTPSKEFALRQLELFNGTVNRLETGVPKTGVNPPESAPPKTIEQIRKEESNNPPAQERTITKEQANAELTRVNGLRQKQGLPALTEEDMNKSLQEKHIKVQ